MFNDFVSFVRELYGQRESIPLHEPRFAGNERTYVMDALDSTFVSSVGRYVDLFEQKVADSLGVGFAIATVNGTAALHTALLLAGVGRGDEVLTQSLTFAATSAAIRYCLAEPIFIDIERATLGMSPEGLEAFLATHAEIVDGVCRNRSTGAVIRACLPMHTFGHPVRIDAIAEICSAHNILLLEDAAESLGSRYQGRSMGSFGEMAVLSFNGNKIITTGGGGMLITNNEAIARRARHLTTTAKLPHRWAYEHNEIGYNYRLPNINAALGVAQMELLNDFIENKRMVAEDYREWCTKHGLQFVGEPEQARSNYWLNAILLENVEERNRFLEYTNAQGVMTRPAWRPMHLLPMYSHCQCAALDATMWVYERLVNIPSSITVSPGILAGH